MGEDLHWHGRADVCGAACPLRKVGRGLQYAALQTVERRIGFAMVKAIDGLPRVNGTTPLMTARVFYYKGGPVARQNYYESIGSAAELRRQLIVAQRLPDCREPRVVQDSFALVLEVFESAHTAAGGVLLHPKVGERSLGLHFVVVEEYDEETEQFRFWNSWGTGWGQRGYGEVSFRYVSDFFHEGFVTRYARWGPTPTKLPKMLAAQDVREFRRLWSIENPRSVSILRGPGERTSRIRRYESVSPTTNDPVMCLEVTTGFGLRMGWAFLRHLSDSSSVTEVTELFVWPAFRNLGIERGREYRR
jgi:hypothetical protein